MDRLLSLAENDYASHPDSRALQTLPGALSARSLMLDGRHLILLFLTIARRVAAKAKTRTYRGYSYWLPRTNSFENLGRFMRYAIAVVLLAIAFLGVGTWARA